MRINLNQNIGEEAIKNFLKLTKENTKKEVNLNLKRVDNKTLLFILKQIKKEMKKRGIKKVCKYKIKYAQLKEKCLKNE